MKLSSKYIYKLGPSNINVGIDENQVNTLIDKKLENFECSGGDVSLPEGMPGEVLILGQDNKPTWSVSPTSTPQNLGLGQIVYTANTKTPIEGTLFANGSYIIRDHAPELYDTLMELDVSNFPLDNQFLIHPLYNTFSDNFELVDDIKNGTTTSTTAYREYTIGNIRYRTTGYAYGQYNASTNRYLFPNIFTESTNETDYIYETYNSANGNTATAEFWFIDGSRYNVYAMSAMTGYSSSTNYTLKTLTLSGFNEETSSYEEILSFTSPKRVTLESKYINHENLTKFYNKFKIDAVNNTSTNAAIIRYARIYGTKEGEAPITDYRVLPKVTTTDGSVACVVATNGLQDWTKERVVGYLGNKKIYERYFSGVTKSTTGNWNNIVSTDCVVDKVIYLQGIEDVSTGKLVVPFAVSSTTFMSLAVSVDGKYIMEQHSNSAHNAKPISIYMCYTKITD